jgi:gluconokinase
MKYILAVDIGTTNAKVASYTFDGKQVTFVTAAYGQTDITLQDANVILETTLCLLTQTLNELTQKDAVREIAKLVFSSAMHSVLFLDEKFNPLSPVYTWANNYGQEFLADLKKQPVVQELYFKTGTPLHPMAPFVKLYGFRQTNPWLLQQSAYIVGIKEYLLWNLTAQLKMDWGIASATGLMIDYQWNETLLACVGLSKEKLPTLVAPTYEANLMITMAKKLGLPATTKVVWGSSDGVLANLGVSQKEQELVLTLGTSGALRVISNQPNYMAKSKLFCYVVDDNHWLIGGPSNNGGNVLAWFKENFGWQDSSYSQMLAHLDDSTCGANGLLFLPYLYGERAPLWQSDAKAQFIGLTAQHTREDLLRAVVEGILLNMASIVDLMQQQLGQSFTKIKVTGGFFQTPICCQLLADILDKEVVVMPKQEGSCLGALKLVIHDLSLPITTIRYSPKEQNVQCYRNVLANFKDAQIKCFA